MCRRVPIRRLLLSHLVAGFGDQTATPDAHQSIFEESHSITHSLARSPSDIRDDPLLLFNIHGDSVATLTLASVNSCVTVSNYGGRRRRRGKRDAGSIKRRRRECEGERRAENHSRRGRIKGGEQSALCTLIAWKRIRPPGLTWHVSS